MTADSIRNQMTMQPFRPFHVHTAAGPRYFVRHPDFAWIAPNGRDFVVAGENDGIAILSLLHVTELEVAPLGESPVRKSN